MSLLVRCALGGAGALLAHFLFGVGNVGAFLTGVAVGLLAKGFASIDAKPDPSDREPAPPNASR